MLTIPDHNDDDYRRPIDMDLVKEAGKLLHGVNDFRAFTTPKVRQMLESIEPDKWGPRSVKDMEVKVYPTSHFIADENVSEYYSGSYQMWNITFKSSSFIYRQVRWGLNLVSVRAHVFDSID